MLACTLLTGLIASAACVADGPEPGPSTASPTTGDTPSPTPDPRLALTAAVATAGMLPAELGGAQPKAEQTIGKLAMPCNAPLTAQNVAAHSWTFSAAKPGVVSHSVFAYYPEAGTTVIEEIRPAVTGCQTWNWAGTWDLAVLGEFAVTAPAGVDNVVAYCHRGTVLAGANKGDQAHVCDGFVSRGHLVAQVTTVQVGLPATQVELRKALPLAGAALVRAVTAP